MGKIGFRIRSSRKGQVPVYVYVYRPCGAREEVKTGLYVLLHNWDTDSQRSVGISFSDLELNEALDRVEQHLLRVMNQNDIKGMSSGDSILEKHAN